jgi:Bacterial SH3 domain
MPMNFEEAEARFRELQARVQRGEAISRAEYEDQVSQLAVQDRNGVLWEINPRTGKWMYFDGAEWVSGTPPGHDTSAVIPIPGRGAAGVSAPPPPPSFTPPSAPPPPPPVQSPKPVTPLPVPPRASAPPPTPSRAAAPPPVPPRPVTPPTAGGPPSFAPPESLQAPARPQGRQTVSPPRAPAAPTSSKPQGASPLAIFGPNREWIPLAIGAVVLLLCALLLFVGGNLALGALGGGAKPTLTRTLVATLPVVATPIPTRVALPTQLPPTATPQPVLAKVIETKVNVRAGPSTKDKIISSVKKNDQLTLVARNADSTWYQINIAGVTGPAWVFGQTLQITSGDPKTLPVAGAGTATPKPIQPTPTLLPLGTLPTPTSSP